jgi:3-oxoacyl-(acyl-carrier-protein) synthase
MTLEYRFCSQSRSAQDVVITGLGLITPLARGREASWQRLQSGDRACRRLDGTDLIRLDQLTTLLRGAPAGAPVDHTAVAAAVNEQLERRCRTTAGKYRDTFGRDVLNNMVAHCLLEAVDDAGLPFETLAHDRVGCVIGTSKASLRAIVLNS